MSQKKEKPIDVDKLIDKAVTAAINAAHIIATRNATDAYKATEKRLYAYPVLLDKIAAEKEMVTHILTHGSPERSQSVKRFARPGIRLTPDEIVSTVITDMEATIAADEHEAATIAAALHTIQGDTYYRAVEGRFIHGMTDVDIADSIPCDPTTVRRNRGRLIRKLAIRLYGTQAL